MAHVPSAHDALVTRDTQFQEMREWSVVHHVLGRKSKNMWRGAGRMQQREKEGEEGKEGEQERRRKEWKQERKRRGEGGVGAGEEREEGEEGEPEGRGEASTKAVRSDKQRVDKLRPADWKSPGLQSEFALGSYNFNPARSSNACRQN